MIGAAAGAGGLRSLPRLRACRPVHLRWPGSTGVAVALAGDQPARVRVRVPRSSPPCTCAGGRATSPARGGWRSGGTRSRGHGRLRQYNAAMGFDLGAELSAVRGQGYDLHSKYLNPQLPRTLRTIGFDKDYVRGEGAYLYDAEGNAYADFLAGFGVFAAGRSHPVIKKALHDALDMDFAAWTQFDCQPIAGLLAQRLIAKTPGLDRVFFCSSGTEAVESALKFARHATGKGRDHLRPSRVPRADRGLAVGQRRRGVQARLRAAAAGHRDPARRPRRARGGAAQGRRGGDDRRAGPGSRRDDAAARLPARGGGAAAQARRAADLRRGAGRARPHRQVLLLPARGRAARTS